MTSGHRRGRGWEALAVAALVNVVIVLVLDGIVLDPAPPRRSARPVGPALDAVAWVDGPTRAASVGFVVVLPPALSLEAVLGVGDATAWTGAAPVRPRSAELPGDRAADRGGGDVGGTASWTDRRDRASDAALRSRIWNSPDAYRSPRTDRGRRAASPEAINRDAQAYGDRAPATLARAGAAQASTGQVAGVGATGLPLTTAGAPDATSGAPGATTPARVDGAPRATHEAAYVDPGARAVDVTRKGATADDRAVAAASNQRHVDAFDLTPPRSGGAHDGEGVAGAAAPGLLADGRGRGTAASRAEVPAGSGGASTFATRQDPYFVELFRRLDRLVEYPPDLRVRMVSGRVIAMVVLRADGSLADVAVHAGSGHAAFDDTLTDALRQLGRLDPVPRALLEGRRELRVMIPYTFRSPMIR